MQAITFRDERLYKITAHDYGDTFHRVAGLILHAVGKGFAFAILVGITFLTPRLSFRDWFTLLVPVSLVCAVLVAVIDPRSYTCEIEIFPDRIIRHSVGKTLGIGRSEVRFISEGRSWTPFGWVEGLSVRSKGKSIFIPAACPDFAEIKSKLGAWRSFSG